GGEEGHRGFAGDRRGVAALEEGGGHHAAEDVTEAGDHERDPRDGSDAGEVETAGGFQVFREPENVEIPDRIEENFRDSERDDEAAAEEREDRDRLFRGRAGGGGGRVIPLPPEDEPEESGDADEQECRLPAEIQKKEGDDGRS